MIRNEHIVWAYAEREDGDGQIVVIGLTDLGVEHMRSEYGQSLVINPPGRGFSNVTQIVVYMGGSKEELKDTLRKAGVPVSEVN